MNKLNAFFEYIKPMTDALHISLDEVTHVNHYSRGTHLVNPGSVPRYLFFIVNGMVETYWNNNNQQFIAEFSGPNEISFSLQNMFFDYTTNHGTFALADTEVLCLPYNAIRRIGSELPEFTYHIHHLIENKLWYLYKHIEFLSQTTDIRLSQFLENFIHHFHAVPRSHVSRFLFMSETQLYTLLQRQRQAATLHHKRH